jgi:predicted transposase/invertase (TIGR01784 family)
MQIGRTEEKQEIAKKLKVFGMTVEQIVQATGLSIEEIEAL